MEIHSVLSEKWRHPRSAAGAHICTGCTGILVILKADLCCKRLWSPSGSHNMSLKSVYLKKLSDSSSLVEESHLHSYLLIWTQPFKCRFQARTFQQVCSSNGYVLPSKGISVSVLWAHAIHFIYWQWCAATLLRKRNSSVVGDLTTLTAYEMQSDSRGEQFLCCQNVSIITAACKISYPMSFSTTVQCLWNMSDHQGLDCSLLL